MKSIYNIAHTCSIMSRHVIYHDYRSITTLQCITMVSINMMTSYNVNMMTIHCVVATVSVNMMTLYTACVTMVSVILTILTQCRIKYQYDDLHCV